MTFLQLSYIVAVSEENSISRAAEKLHVAQPSISRLINALEQEYGVKLFRRSAHNVELTYAGKIFVEHAQLLLTQQRNLDSILHDLGNSHQGRLTFGCSSNHIGYMLPPLLQRLNLRFPYLELSVVNDTSVNLLRQTAMGKIDLIYTHTPLEKNEELQYIPVTQEELLLVVPCTHPLARRAEAEPNWRKRRPVQLREIAGEPFIQLRKNHSIRILTDQLFREHGFSPSVRLDSSSNGVAHKLVASGLGVSILPESELRFNPTDPPCVFFPIEDRRYTRQIFIGCQKSLYPTTVITSCIDIVTDIAQHIFVEGSPAGQQAEA